MKKQLMICQGLLLAFSFAQVDLHAQSVGSFEDGRDGRTYKTVRYELIGAGQSTTSMTWMAQNLSFESEDSYCTEDSAASCETYGRLYTWSAAKNACPKGWHLPSDDEWIALADLFGGVSLAGTALKGADDLWPGGKGSNESQFGAKPAGTRGGNGGYHNLGSEAIFWSSVEKDGTEGWDWKLLGNWSKIQRWNADKRIGNSVRCVQD